MTPLQTLPIGSRVSVAFVDGRPALVGTLFRVVGTVQFTIRDDNGSTVGIACSIVSTVSPESR